MKRDKNVLSFDELFSEYKRLAKMANSRLDRLRAKGWTNFRSYKGAMKYIQSVKPNATHFSLAKPLTTKELRSAYNRVSAFIESSTSTIGGVRKTYQKVCDTIREKYGLNLTPEQLEGVFESALWQKLEEVFIGSNTAIRVLASIQKTKGDITNTLKSASAKRLGISKGEKQKLRDVMEEFVTPNDSELKEIRGFFPE